MKAWDTFRNLIVQSLLKLQYGALIEYEDLRGTRRQLNTRFLTDVQNARAPETLTAARTLTSSDSGKTFYLSLAAGFTVTLPTIAEGLRFKFFVKTAPTGGAYAITGAATSTVLGVNELEVDTGDDGPSSSGTTTVSFAANVALPGDYLEYECDGTKWYAIGQTRADGGITIA